MKRFLVISAIITTIGLSSFFVITSLSDDAPATDTPTDQRSSSTQILTNRPTTISPEAVKTLLDNQSDLTLIDVRTKEEFQNSHIPGAILLPHDQIAELAITHIPSKSTPVVVYCASGVRSARAAAALADLGYTDVRDLGGLADWSYETISGDLPL